MVFLKLVHMESQGSPSHTASFWNIIIQLTSHDLTKKLVSLVSSTKLGNWKKKPVKWQKFKTALCNLKENLFLLNFFSLPFWTEILNHSGSQIHGWTSLKKKFYCISFYSSFCRASPFHREWPQLVTILTSFDLPFEKKFKSLKY